MGYRVRQVRWVELSVGKKSFVCWGGGIDKVRPMVIIERGGDNVVTTKNDSLLVEIKG